VSSYITSSGILFYFDNLQKRLTLTYLWLDITMMSINYIWWLLCYSYVFGGRSVIIN